MPVLRRDPSAIPYRVRRSRRAAKLRVVVRPGGVEVVAPTRARDADIAAFVEQSRAWIADKVQTLRRTLEAHPGSGALGDGARILLRGDPIWVTVTTRGIPRPRVRLDGDLRVDLPPKESARDAEPAIEQALTRWLKKEARADAVTLVARHGPEHGLVPGSLRIKAQRSLWGSCSPRGAINLNWRLIFAPSPVFEYVVVHELCHLRERHHQAAFWRLVGTLLPDFAEHRRWLKDNGHLLCLKPGGFG